MTKKELAKRLFALVLTFMMTLSMTGYDFVEAFAEDGEVTTVEENEGTLDETENGGGETGGSTDNSVTPEDAAAEPDVKPEAVPETVTEPVAPAAEAEVQLAEITVKASKDENFVSVFWQKVDGAAYYMVSLAEDKNGILEAQEQKVEAGKECKWVFKSDKGGTVKVEAYRVKAKEENTAETADGETAAAAPEYEKFAEGTAAELDEIKRPKIASGSTQAVYTGHSLRELLGEPNDGYAVAQGAATDGTYAYYMLASSTTQMGRVLKIRLSDGAVVGRGPVIGIHHANGMTYDSKRHKLVAVGYGANRQNLSYIDPDTLKLDEIQPNRTLKYSYASKISGMPSGAQNNGIAAISYIPKYDVYVARSRGKVSGYPQTTGSANNNIWVFNAENLEAICNITRNWVGFTTIWEIDDFEDAKAFAAWADIDDDYVYCFWTRDVKCVNQLTQDSTIPAKLNGQYNCTACLYGGYDFAAAVLACGASINWDRAQGMKTWAFKSATGIEPIVNDESSANALEKIRCSYYGSFSARNSRFQFMYDGALCSTYYGYIDTLYGAIYIRSMIQRSCMDGLTQVNRAPFNSMGEAFIRAWMQDPINKAINNGSMDRGITLNASQKQQILTETQSETAASDIELNGYWARIDLSDASQRSQRHATTVALYWAYAGSVHKMDIEAVTVL